MAKKTSQASRAKVPAKPVAIVPARTTSKNARVLWLGITLLVVVAAVYLGATRNGFVNFDDPMYVTANPHVQQGLTFQAIRWAFTTLEGGFWHPLTWLSIIVDCRIFGLHSGGHHLTALFIHATNSVLVFLVLHKLTGTVWRSFFPAALFGLHPLHVESVAWAAERKDILSTMFGFLALWAYAEYAGSNGPSVDSRPAQKRRTKLWYAQTLLFLVLGLMSKTMIVTLPMLFLLLDFWPLRRISFPATGFLGRPESGTPPRSRSLSELLLEKTPFFLLSAGLGLVTLIAQHQVHAMGSARLYPFTDRLANAVLSYGTYALQTFWPSGLAVYYPYPKAVAAIPLILSTFFFCAMSVLGLFQIRPRPYLLFGWLWYVLTLLPVIGLVQAGGQSHADRYTYVPLIGFFVILAFLTAEAVSSRPQLLRLSVISGVAAVVVCAALTYRQIGFWKDSETLFEHALQVTHENEFVRNNLGTALVDKERTLEALVHFEEAVRLMPESPEARNNLGSALGKLGRYDEAIAQLQQALTLDPASASTECNLADAYSAKGDPTAAVPHYEQALKMKPDDPVIHFNLGLALATTSRFPEAISHYRETVRLEPHNAMARNKLGVTLAMTGRSDEAVAELREAVKTKPDFAEAHCNLGIALVQAGQIPAAVPELEKALQLKPDYAQAHCNLGVAVGRLGNLDSAVAHLQKALELRPDYKEASDNLRIALAQQQNRPPSPRARPSGMP
jgi:tetratricopeptide (TPR) repeat protein